MWRNGQRASRLMGTIEMLSQWSSLSGLIWYNCSKVFAIYYLRVGSLWVDLIGMVLLPSKYGCEIF